MSTIRSWELGSHKTTACAETRTKAGLEAARRQGRVGGRPRALSPAGAAEATRMEGDDQTVTHIAAALHVSRATIYRHIAALSSPAR